MYGFIKYGKEKEAVIIGNDGIKYYLRRKNNFYRYGTRVEFESDFYSQAYNVKVLQDSHFNGMIIQLRPEKTGLALMETGEVLEFNEKSFSKLFSGSVYVGMKISGTAKNAVKNSSFGQLHNIDRNIDRIITSKVRDVIYTRYSDGDTVPLKQIISFLKKKCIISYKYSYQDSVLFIENMTDIIKINYREKTVDIVSRISDNYAYALEIAEKNMGFEKFTVFQELALRDDNFWNQRNIFLMGATSSGKTVLPILKYLVDRKKSGTRKNMLIAVPYRALVYQMYNKLKELFKDFHLDIVLSTSEIVEHDMKITNGDVDIAIIIYEKIFMRVSTIDNVLERYDYITLDEFGIVQSEERGIKAEMVLLAGYSAKRPEITVMGTPYLKWDSYIEKYNLYPVRAYSRPVPVQEFFYVPQKIHLKNYKTGNITERNVYHLTDSDGNRIHTGKGQSFLDTLVNLCISEWKHNKKAIVFKFSQKNVQTDAVTIYKRLKKEFGWADVTESERESFKNKLLRTYNLTDEELDMVFDSAEDIEALMYGITFHHSSLPEYLRIAIEQEFFDVPKIIDGGIKLIFATETLAFGLNGNVDTVIITGISKTEFNVQRNLTMNEYRNCIGRSGRLGYLNYGNSYTFISETDSKKNIENYCRILNQQSVFGAFGKVLESHMLKRYSFCLMGLFHERKPLSVKDITDILMSVPCSEEMVYENLYSDVEEALSFLAGEKLLSCRSGQDDYDDIYESQNVGKQYILTVHGEKIQGYCITVDSYKITGIACRNLIKGNNRYLVDYFFSITVCTETITVCNDMLFVPKDDRNLSDKSQWHDIHAVVGYFDRQVDTLCSCNLISEEFADSIRNSRAFEYVRQGKLPEEDDLFFLARLKTAFIALMWVSGYSPGLMCDIYGFDKGKMNNIKRKIGEKLSYITDVVLAVSSTDNISGEIIRYIRQLSICLMYGINIEWLAGTDIEELLPDEAQSYHTASIYYQRRRFIEEYGTEQQKITCAGNYENLGKKAKKILEMKGV